MTHNRTPELKFSDNPDEEDENINKKTGIACDRLRKAVKECLKQSDCVQVDRRSAKECVKNGRDDGSVPEKCFSLLTTLYQCKTSMIDRRARFRGRKGDL
ncbi:hypothetical protein DdX_15349 [Ditylenchus destructor]|uniref:Cytochrome c oxidase assembly factor 5 n=1 Tax=Ditylenchus destructor TaxID=166010 RepID=A0AAD4MSD4_9BILA|nr:hypothetical protein DdX_15349 [Ditylenchus destructor]